MGGERGKKKLRQEEKRENAAHRAGVTNLPAGRPASAPPALPLPPRGGGRGAGSASSVRLPRRSAPSAGHRGGEVTGRGVAGTAPHRGVSVSSGPGKLPVKPGRGGEGVTVSPPRFKLAEGGGEVKARGGPGGCPAPRGLPRPGTRHRAPACRSAPLRSCRRGEARRGGGSG